MNQGTVGSTYQTNIPFADCFYKYDNLESGQRLQEPRRCRICLQQTGVLVQLPCQCIGQIGLVHESCFSQWVTAIRNDRFRYQNVVQGFNHVQNDVYEMPCEICKAKIQMQMKQEIKCFTCKDLLSMDKFISILCLAFMTAVTVIVIVLCIMNLINPNSDTARKLVLVLIMLIFIITLICLIKREVSQLMVKSISELKIIPKEPQMYNTRENKTNQGEICDFLDENQYERQEMPPKYQTPDSLDQRP